MNIYEKLAELGLELPTAPAKGGLYAPVKLFGSNLAYVSGCGPSMGEPVTGRLGEDFTIEEGQLHARNCMLNVLAVLHANLGDLNRIKCFAKVLTFVACADNFTSQPAVANGGTGLLMELFGEEGLPARSAVGVNVLPGNMPVETEALIELYE